MSTEGEWRRSRTPSHFCHSFFILSLPSHSPLLRTCWCALPLLIFVGWSTLVRYVLTLTVGSRRRVYVCASRAQLCKGESPLAVVRQLNLSYFIWFLIICNVPFGNAISSCEYLNRRKETEPEMCLKRCWMPRQEIYGFSPWHSLSLLRLTSRALT